MRVVDNSVKPASHEMPNKGRRRQRRESEVYEDSSDEGVEAAGQSGVQCPHINKGVNQAQVKKALQKGSPHLECVGCSKEGASGARGRTEPAADTCLDEELEATLWLCLQCGHQGCGRNSRSQHALKHYETPRSGCHSVVVNTTTWMVWCYECDNDVAFDRGKKLALCVDFVRRHYGVHRPNDSTGKKSPQQTSPREETVDAGAAAGKGTDKQNLNSAKSPLARVKGLNNLGNTCFFNAVMQNLSQTHVLEAALMWSTKGGSMTLYPPTANDLPLQLEPLEVMLSVPPSALQSALLSFLREMTAPTGKASLNPKHLFGQVCQKSPRFKGFQQQDSHELLRYLLDGLRLEELKRVKSGILRKFGLSESTNPKTVDDDVKGRVKEYGRLVRETFVDFVFGGQMVNTVQCEECKNISQVHEPFLDISLPIVEERSPPSRSSSNPSANKQKGKGAKGRTNLDSETGEAAHMAMNELAQRDDQSPSKHQLKKAKKQARREAKKAQKKGKTPPASEVTSPTADPAGDDGQEETEAKTEAQQQKVAAEESDTSQEKGENPSSSMEDADECSDSEAITKPSSKPTTPKHSPSQESAPAVNPPPTEESGDAIEEKDVKEVTKKLEAMGIEAEHNYAVKSDKSKPQGPDRPTSLEGSSKEKTSSKTQSEQTSSEASCKAKSVTEDVNSTESELCSRIDHLRMSGTESDATSPTQSPDRTQDDIDKGSGNDTQDIKTQDVPEDENPKIIPQGEDVQDNKEVEEAEEKTTTTIVSQEGKNGSFPSITLTQGSPKKVTKTVKDERNECLKSKVQYSFEEISEEGAVGGRGRSNSESRVGDEIVGNTKPPSTLAPRYLGSSQECSIQFCLHQFTAPELLTGSNKFGCEFCTRRKRKESGKTEREKDKDDTVYCNASKQMLVSWPPDVLTLHLKRFQQAGFSLRKVNRHVNFPLMLDLAPFCTSTCKPIADNYNRILYTLYGIVEHSGSLRAGHYTAYVKVRQASDKLRTQVLNKPNSWNYGKGTPRNKVGAAGHHGNLVNGDISLEESDDEVDWKGGDSAPLPPVPEGKWYHISDTHVSEVSESKVLNAQAFLLFYERILS
ncbi:PREDICTED: ubiquitin carboxyl-terminal hydrolase 16-like [Branchiostoma belcheri]|uniref:ubiquitinyl hydrolase 1 n=1 Tax=Branchiostoma belcheri TaxID=7741 RepID=A0A6P5AL52_BRABE|nr:PREDICTED: ubiquitin carboxyl-terminal hydrolase 16-like [Branchiostoma belcheri]XP_019646955.1 PREDICTED: ubiquitin carboxyl-terminal hydrolase 16-like [Branchiostoma belcheri]